MGTSCVKLLFQFYADCFETLHELFCSWSEEVHMFWILSSDYFCYLFDRMSLSPFRHYFCQSDLKLEFILKLKIKHSDWLLADTRLNI